MTAARSYDVLLATDCRFPGGTTSSVVDEIRAQTQAGYRTGLLHLPSPALDGARRFAPRIREVLESDAAELVLPGDTAAARLLLVRHESLFTDVPADLPRLRADQVVVTVGTVAAARKRSGSDLSHMQRNIERLVGATAVWAPTGPAVRERLTPYAGDFPLFPDDWEGVIDVAQWQVKRDGYVSDRPVIGRHGRDHWSKWPRHKRDIKAAYPDDPRYSVRVLGGTETPAKVLGRDPANWQSLPFDSMPAPEFLAGIDFLVYFHHPKVVKAFGRAILEGLAAGAVPIVPRYLEPIFGEACLYGEASDVLGHIDELYDDWDTYSARSQAGVETVQRRFGYDRHIERIARLIGAPSSEPALPAPQLPREHGTVIIDLTRGTELDAIVSSVVRATVNVGGPRVVAMPAARAAALDGRVPAETFPRMLDRLGTADRHRYLQHRLAGIISTHRPARVLVVDDGYTAARDVLTPAPGAGTDIWHVQPVGPSAPVGDTLAEHVAAVLPRDWGISRMTPRAGPVPTGSAARTDGDVLTRVNLALRRQTDALVTRLRRWMLYRLKAGVQASGLVLFEMDESDAVLPVPAGSAQPEPTLLPVTLVVITDDYGDPHRAIRAIVERQQVSGTFRAALLAPPDWEPPAAAAGLTVETLLPESTWTALYGSGWDTYVRRRIDDTCRALGPATLVHSAGPFGGSDDATVVLDILESARVRRRAGGEAP